MNDFDVIIIGGGASGLMCALSAGQRKRRVLVVDHNDLLGKKILASGGGHCNFTNLYTEYNNYISANPSFCKSALKRYPPSNFIAMVQKHHIPYHERQHGELFCDTSSQDILTMLINECKNANVDFRVNCHIKKIEPLDHSITRFKLTTHQGTWKTLSLVIATGGLSMPTLGASSFGFDIAKQFGIRVLPTQAGLVPFMFSDHFKMISERLSGISLKVTLSTSDHSFTEQLLFTHRGLSGPVVLQLSNYWKPGDTILLDLLPNMNIAEWLKKQKQANPKKLLRTLFLHHFPKKLVQELETLFWQPWAETWITNIPNTTLATIAKHLRRWQLKPSGTEGYRTAEVTLGGVDTRELSSKTMESKTQPGLFFIGEVVDITGQLGGFNLQWAWSSGYTAGQFV